MLEEVLIGVDEAGRGPLAGPVAVGVVAILPGFDIRAEFKGVTDSKLLTALKRETLYEEVLRRVAQGDVCYTVKFSTHSYIDRFGITRAVRKAAWSGVRQMGDPSSSTVLLDGLLRAPKEYMQRTVIGGDLRVPVISLASIVAKVERDRLMEQLSATYPQYGFESHKGYATPEHYRALRAHGPCEIHRLSYCSFLGLTATPARA
ncbi:MAG: ribonuclease HII [Patescibacteria group bacterium]|nr:ribonuclease HII [Patescibacteria group bacterium]